jgi:hypothetical protein
MITTHMDSGANLVKVVEIEGKTQAEVAKVAGKTQAEAIETEVHVLDQEAMGKEDSVLTEVAILADKTLIDQGRVTVVKTVEIRAQELVKVKITVVKGKVKATEVKTEEIRAQELVKVKATEVRDKVTVVKGKVRVTVVKDKAIEVKVKGRVKGNREREV